MLWRDKAIARLPPTKPLALARSKTRNGFHELDHHVALEDAAANANWDRRISAARMLRETVDAVNALNLDAPDEKVMAEIVEARDALDQALANLRGIAGRRGCTAKSSQRDELSQSAAPVALPSRSSGPGPRRTKRPGWTAS